MGQGKDNGLRKNFLPLCYFFLSTPLEPEERTESKMPVKNVEGEEEEFKAASWKGLILV